MPKAQYALTQGIYIVSGSRICYYTVIIFDNLAFKVATDNQLNIQMFINPSVYILLPNLCTLLLQVMQ